MAYDSYSDTEAPSNTKPEEKDEGEESAESSALIPKSLLAGKDFKVGEEVVFKIVHLFEDQVEIEYSKETASKEDHPEPHMDDPMVLKE